jgi:hypothetical protein
MTAHLLHVGYPKAGTNYIRRWFAAHPELAFAHGGIGGFYDVYAMATLDSAPPPAWRVTSLENFVLPKPRPGDPENIPVSAWVEGRARICARLVDFFPGAHVLIVTRGYAGMSLSSYSQYVRSGGMLTIEQLRLLGVGDWLDYEGAQAEYRAAFGADRVTILPYELLRDHPRAFFNALATRLGIAAHDPPSGHPNRSLSPVELAWYPRLAVQIDRLPLPGLVKRRARRRLARFAFTNGLERPIAWLQRWRPLPPVSPEMLSIEELQQQFPASAALRDLAEYQPYLADYFLA